MVAETKPRVNAFRGTTLRCKSWRQEAIQRMLVRIFKATERLSRMLTNDAGLGALWYRDAGYETAAATARDAGLGLGE